MRLSLAGRMFAALFGMSAIMVALMVAWSVWALDERFSTYVGASALAGMDRLARTLERDYAEHGDWSGIAGDPAAWATILHDTAARPPPPPLGDFDGPPQDDPRQPAPDWADARTPPWRGHGPPGGPPFGAGPPGAPPFGPPPGLPPDGPAGRPGGQLALIDAAGGPVAGDRATMRHPARRPLAIGDRKIGILLFDAGPLPGSIEAAFLAERARDLYFAGGVALLLSGLVSVLLARHILSPIRLVMSGAQRLAAGHFATRIEASRRDELGDLMRDFNRLAAALDASEQARRLWVADTSHELRTPLAVLQAQIEALQDGVHAVGAQSLGRLHQEVLRMTRLVADLHELARADSRALALQPEPVRPGEIMAEVLAGFSARRQAAGLRLDLSGLGTEGGTVLADPGRLRQVFSNLAENAIRYTEPGGLIRVGESLSPGSVTLCMEDTAPGVAAAKLPRLFERFYRVETSRSRDTGGSGLGLAICRAIVEAHGGTILAAVSSLGGLSVTVSLPSVPREPS